MSFSVFTPDVAPEPAEERLLRLSAASCSCWSSVLLSCPPVPPNLPVPSVTSKVSGSLMSLSKAAATSLLSDTVVVSLASP